MVASKLLVIVHQPVFVQKQLQVSTHIDTYTNDNIQSLFWLV